MRASTRVVMTLGRRCRYTRLLAAESIDEFEALEAVEQQWAQHHASAVRSQEVAAMQEKARQAKARLARVAAQRKEDAKAQYPSRYNNR